jgi:glycogen operon protein
VKNFLALTLLSTGTPMLLMGDEIRRTQRGNNNAYCLDDETTWFDWSGVVRHADLQHFVRQLIAIRRARTLPVELMDVTLNELIAQHPVEWHGVTLGEPDWSDTSHSVAATVHFKTAGVVLHLMINAYWEALSFAIPPLDENYVSWRCCVDTFRSSPRDIRAWVEAETVQGQTFIVQPRSIVVLVTKFHDMI